MTRVILQMYGIKPVREAGRKGIATIKSCVLDYTDGLRKAKLEGVI